MPAPIPTDPKRRRVGPVLVKALTKQSAGIALAVIAVIVALVVPGGDLLPREGVLMLGAFAMAAVLWICESLPVGVTGILALVLTMLLGIATPAEAFSGFASPTWFYLLGAFSLSAVFSQTSYGMRLVVFLLRKTGGNARLIVLAFMASAWLLSSVMSDTAAVLMFIGIAKGVLDALGCRPRESNFGRCLYIGLLYGAIVGGFATMAGGPNNMAVLQISGISVSFVEWMIVGVPIAVVMLPVCWLFVTRAFPPETFPVEQYEAIIAQTEELGRPTLQERKALVFVVLMPMLWIVGNWVPILNVTVVALLGLVIAFLPGVRLLTWDQYQRSVPWVVLIMIGAVFSLSALMVKTGVIGFVGHLVEAAGIFALPFPVALLLYLLFAYGVFTLCPVGGVWEALFVPVLVGACATAGVSGAIAPFAILFAFGGNFLLPINPLNMYAYAHGYFRPLDMLRAGAAPAIVLIVIDALWTPFIVGLVGL